jgi:hypothetical protein
MTSTWLVDVATGRDDEAEPVNGSIRLHARRAIVALLVASALSACGLYGSVSEDDHCDLKPLAAAPSGFSIGPQRVAALCATQVEVNGRTYSPSCGRFLDEDKLLLDEYGVIARANTPVEDPAVYALRGVDPLQVLVSRGTCQVDDFTTGAFWVLVAGFPLPASICQYADPSDSGYPGDSCPLQAGRTYTAALVIGCGLDVPQGPFGGAIWMITDPPALNADGRYPGLSAENTDFGQIEVVDRDHAIYRSEVGAVLELRRISDEPAPTPVACDKPALGTLGND